MYKQNNRGPRDASLYVERNKYAPWGRGEIQTCSPYGARAPYVWVKGNQTEHYRKTHS